MNLMDVLSSGKGSDLAYSIKKSLVFCLNEKFLYLYKKFLICPKWHKFFKWKKYLYLSKNN